MDVENIQLESNDDFLCQVFFQNFGKDILLVRNRVNDGNIIKKIQISFKEKKKGIVANLDEVLNPVLMLVKH